MLLTKLGLPFVAAAPKVDETPLPGETPVDLAVRLADLKARALSASYPAHLIIGSDQVAAVDGRPLGKPGHAEAAFAQLRAAAGRSMQFYTALTVWNSRDGVAYSALDCTTVHFRALSDAQLRAYIEREQPYDCAGSFKSEGLGITLFERIEGTDPNALIGLPLIQLVDLLEKFGVAVL